MGSEPRVHDYLVTIRTGLRRPQGHLEVARQSLRETPLNISVVRMCARNVFGLCIMLVLPARVLDKAR